MKAIIRVAQPIDLDKIAEVNLKSWQHVCLGLIPESLIESFTLEECFSNWQQRFALSEASGENILVADLNGVLGFAYFGPSKDADNPGQCGQVYLIYVAPDAIGTGAGKALMESSLTALAARGFVEVTLWVLALNQHAREFYCRQGFQLDGCTDMDKRTGTSRLRYHRALPLSSATDAGC